MNTQAIELVDPTVITPAQIPDLCRAVEAEAAATDDVQVVTELHARWSAVTEYLSITSRTGLKEAKATKLHLQARIGELTPAGPRGPAPGGGPRVSRDDPKNPDLSKDQLYEARKLAANPEALEDVIAVSTDDNPPTVAGVLNRIQERQTITDQLTEALNREPTADEFAEALAENDESKRVWTSSKPDLGYGVSHPARYSNELLPAIRAALLDTVGPGAVVLDPFAGTGRIHELHPEFDTIGVELEPEWANLHERTRIGDARRLPFDDDTIDAIATSPTYGNRLADHHLAIDPDHRRSYTHDLGRDLTDGNTGVLHWRNGGDGSSDYRTLHWEAWAEAVRVLRPGGVLVLNMKDHYRSGLLQPVTAWHCWALGRLGLDYFDSVAVPTRDLRQGANGKLRSQETLHVFRKVDS